MIQDIPETVDPKHRAIVGFEWEVIERWLRAAPDRSVWFDGERWGAADWDPCAFTAPTVPLLAGKLADDLVRWIDISDRKPAIGQRVEVWIDWMGIGQVGPVTWDDSWNDVPVGRWRPAEKDGVQ